MSDKRVLLRFTSQQAMVIVMVLAAGSPLELIIALPTEGKLLLDLLTKLYDEKDTSKSASELLDRIVAFGYEFCDVVLMKDGDKFETSTFEFNIARKPEKAFMWN